MSPKDTQTQTTFRLGRYRGRTFHLAVRADPSLEAQAPEEFAVVLFLSTPEGDNIDIARIDTADAGVHYDRLYLSKDHPKRKDYSADFVDYREAVEEIRSKWRDHVDEYVETHGLPDSETQ